MPPPPTTTTPTAASLHPISNLLHLTAHRNKNQHRLAKWWGPFSQLRRHLRKLIADIESETPLAAGQSAAKWMEERAAARERVRARIAFLNTVLVPRCYLAFSSVVADNQYAALGLMLMGTLARLRKLIAPPTEDEDVDLEEEARSEILASNDVTTGEDLGEVVLRDVAASDLKMVDADDTEMATSTKAKDMSKRKSQASPLKSLTAAAEPVTRKPSKKRRKKGDAIDDLFSSLV